MEEEYIVLVQASHPSKLGTMTEGNLAPSSATYTYSGFLPPPTHSMYYTLFLTTSFVMSVIHTL